MTEVLLTSGTSWTVPSDCTSAKVEAIGAGQGGNATNGGAGGDYAKASAVSLTPGANIAIQIGAGGAGVTSGAQNAGTDTKFGTYVLAKGGGSASADVGDVSFAGGTGDTSGAGGAAAGAGGAGASASGTTPGAGDGDLAGAGGAPASGSASATRVRGGAENGNTASLIVPFSDSGIAVAGDLLTASINYNSSSQSPSATGWTLAGSVAIPGGARIVALFTKIAAGGETGITFNLGAAAACSGAVTEWSGGKAGTVTSGTFVANVSGGTFGPSDAPASPNAIPEMSFGMTGNATPTISSPWTLGNVSAGQISAYANEPAPNGPASGTLSISSGSLNTAWINLWIEPA